MLAGNNLHTPAPSYTVPIMYLAPMSICRTPVKPSVMVPVPVTVPSVIRSRMTEPVKNEAVTVTAVRPDPVRGRSPACGPSACSPQTPTYTYTCI